eukprot:4562036-Pyramimonas_sp.AAC.1
MEWAAIMLWGSELGYGPNNSVTGWCESGWWPTRSIPVYFPRNGKTEQFKAADEGCWDLMVVKGMSTHGAAVRVMHLNGLLADVKWALLEWAPKEMMRLRHVIKRDCCMEVINSLLGLTESWVEASIQHVIQGEVDVQVPRALAVSKSNPKDRLDSEQ